MKTWLFVSLLATSTPGFTQEIGVSCPNLSVSGISSKSKLSNFINSLKVAVTSNDDAALMKAVSFPLRVNENGQSAPINDMRELKKDFPSIFTANILNAIVGQKFEDLFCRDQGVMIGNGEVWITERNGKIGISTINL